MTRRLALIHPKFNSGSSSHSPALLEHPVACSTGGAGGTGPRGAGEEDGWQRGSPARSVPTTLTESTTTSRPARRDHAGGLAALGAAEGKNEEGGARLGPQFHFLPCVGRDH